MGRLLFLGSLHQRHLTTPELARQTFRATSYIVQLMEVKHGAGTQTSFTIIMESLLAGFLMHNMILTMTRTIFTVFIITMETVSQKRPVKHQLGD